MRPNTSDKLIWMKRFLLYTGKGLLMDFSTRSDGYQAQVHGK
jgi:hypothetical protein